MKYKYFVSILFESKNNETGYGMRILERKKKMNNAKEIIAVMEFIKKEDYKDKKEDYKNVIILNFHLLSEVE